MKRARKPKRISSTEAGNILKLPDGRFRIDCLDSRNKRQRRKFATKEEAIAELGKIAAKKSAGGYFADSANTTFATVLGLLKERNETEVGKGARDATNSKINILGSEFGAYKMSWFIDDRLETVQKWFKEQADNGRAKGTLQGDRSVFSMAFKTAVKKEIISYNPIGKFGLYVPRNASESESKPLSLQDMTPLVRGVISRVKQDKDELTFRVRRMMVMLGMFTGMRNEECSGLFWDCVDSNERAIHVRRIWRDGEGIVETTKTGEQGKRSIPISPILLAELLSYSERLRHLGMQLQGPVLITERASIIKSEAISSQHWPVIARKCGFVDQHDDHLFTFYDLRHTAATIWRTIGMEPDDLQALMGHSDYKTTVERYLHRAPHLYPGIRSDVESLRFGQTPEHLIDALGVVLAHRWKDDGIDINCASPRSVRQPLGFNGGLPALSPPTLDLTANAVTIEVPSAPTNQAPIQPPMRSIEDFRKWQRARAIELHAQGWSVLRIQAELGADRTTIQNDWLRNADIPDRRGKLSAVERQEAKQRVRAYEKEHPDATTFEVAKATGVHTRRIAKWARERDQPRPHRTYSYKLEKHEQAIRRMVAEEKTYREMERILNVGISSDADKVSFSGIAWFVKKLGLKTKRWGSGMRVEQFDAEIRQGVAEGKDGKQIAGELHTVHHASICRRIKHLGLLTESETRNHAARARAKNRLQKQQLNLDLGTSFGTNSGG